MPGHRPEFLNAFAQIVEAIDPRDLHATPRAQKLIGSELDKNLNKDKAMIDLYKGAADLPAGFADPSHAGRRCKLTAERAKIICDYIAQGGWDYIAAEAAGISQNRFYNYLERFPVFKRNVDAARAQARLNAEQRVQALEPSKWLRNGPGKDMLGRPGWSANPTVQIMPGANAELSWAGLDNLTPDELMELKRLMEKAKGKPIEVIEGEVVAKLQDGKQSDITDAEIVEE
jgi:hypothetical protein